VDEQTDGRIKSDVEWPRLSISHGSHHLLCSRW